MFVRSEDGEDAKPRGGLPSRVSRRAGTRRADRTRGVARAVEATTEAAGALAMCGPHQRSPSPDPFHPRRDIVARADDGYREGRRSRGRQNSHPSPSPQPAVARFTSVRCYNDTSPGSSARPRAFSPRRILTNNPTRRERTPPSPPNGGGARLIHPRPYRPRVIRADPRSIVPSPIEADPPRLSIAPSTDRLTWARAGSG